MDCGNQSQSRMPPAGIAETESQKASLAELPVHKKYALYEKMMMYNDAGSDTTIAGDSPGSIHPQSHTKIADEVEQPDLSVYHQLSCVPITKKAEDDMELLSDLYTWGERYLHHWEDGIYICSRCHNPLYSSVDKYKGPCVWPSFRKGIDNSRALYTREVFPYNNYTVTVMEVYCGKCKLFIGHQFEDAKDKGDTHPEAHWRQ